MDEIILIGAGGHARACIDIIELCGHYKIAGFIEKGGNDNQKNLGYPVIGTDEDLLHLRQKYKSSLVTIGQIKSSIIRVKLFELLLEMEYKLPVIVSPKAYVSKHARVGEGTIVMHDAIVNANAKVGKNCIINNKALIEHDAVIGDHCHVATGAIVNGEVQVGEGTFIGSGVVTKQSISIGNNCVISAGVVLKSNVESDQVIKN